MRTSYRRPGRKTAVPFLLMLYMLTAPGALCAQQDVSPDDAALQAVSIDAEALLRYTRAHVAMNRTRDEYYGQLARIHEPQEQERLRTELAEALEEILVGHELTVETYDGITVSISTDAELRQRFEQMLADLAAGVLDTIPRSRSLLPRR